MTPRSIAAAQAAAFREWLRGPIGFALVHGQDYTANMPPLAADAWEAIIETANGGPPLVAVPSWEESPETAPRLLVPPNTCDQPLMDGDPNFRCTRRAGHEGDCALVMEGVPEGGLVLDADGVAAMRRLVREARRLRLCVCIEMYSFHSPDCPVESVAALLPKEGT